MNFDYAYTGLRPSPLVNKIFFLLVPWMLMAMLIGCSISPNRSSDSLQLDSKHPSSSSQKTFSVCRSPYKVVWGDTLSGIAVKCKINMDQLAQANNLLPPYFLKVNQKLILPNSGKAAQRQFEKHRKAAGAEKWKWPMNSQLQHRFIRDSAGLNALEIYGLPGLEIKSVQQGEVVYAGNGITHYGLMVMIKHPSGYLSTYAHNSRLMVKSGQRVKAGQVIATLGASGQTERPKLYLEARYRGRKVDAKKLFR